MSDPAQMTRTELAEALGVDESEVETTVQRIADDAKAMMSGLVGDKTECPSCFGSVPIKWSHDHMMWDVECACGWSAAGIGAPSARH